MSDGISARLGLPLIQPGQAQKETTHNEALALIDIAVQPVVVSVGTEIPPVAPVEGECWIVGAAPTAAWAGHDRTIAGWTAGGWRFLVPTRGMTAWSLADNGLARYNGSGWIVTAPTAAIADPSGGTTIDVRTRTAVVAILGALRGHGIIAAS